jgi:hypothetical protein
LYSCVAAVAVSLGRELALGVRPFRLLSCSSGGALAFLYSAVRTHGGEAIRTRAGDTDLERRSALSLVFLIVRHSPVPIVIPWSCPVIFITDMILFGLSIFILRFFLFGHRGAPIDD